MDRGTGSASIPTCPKEKLLCIVSFGAGGRCDHDLPCREAGIRLLPRGSEVTTQLSHERRLFLLPEASLRVLAVVVLANWWTGAGPPGLLENSRPHRRCRKSARLRPMTGNFGHFKVYAPASEARSSGLFAVSDFTASFQNQVDARNYGVARYGMEAPLPHTGIVISSESCRAKGSENSLCSGFRLSCRRLHQRIRTQAGKYTACSLKTAV